MTLLFALSIGIIFGAGTVLALTNDLVRVAAGIVLISQSAILVVIVSGLSRGDAPVLPLDDGQVASDPLVQAMALTAIVIGFAVIALLLAIVARVRSALDLEHTDLVRDEAEQDVSLERSLDTMHEELDPDEAAEEQ